MHVAGTPLPKPVRSKNTLKVGKTRVSQAYLQHNELTFNYPIGKNYHYRQTVSYICVVNLTCLAIPYYCIPVLLGLEMSVEYTTMNMESTGIMSTGNTDYSLTNDYTQWLQQWQKPFALSIHVPPEACKIVTPLQPIAWREYLAMYPDQNLTTFFINGITQGFRIGFDYTLVSLKSSRRNLESAQSHIAVVDDYLKTEIALARVAGPFSPKAVGQGQISRFGVIPKNHQPDKWRLIVDLSYPSSHSINDGIPSALCSLQYVTIDDAVQHILKLGVGTRLKSIMLQNFPIILSGTSFFSHLLFPKLCSQFL